jgi:hypothetical protein
MSFSDIFENAVRNLVFRAQTWANVANDATSTPITNTFSALHTADPGDAGTQATSETTYTGYGRVGVTRGTSGWTAPSGGQIFLAADAVFGAGMAGSGTITHFSQGKTNTGATDIFASGTYTPNLAVGNGITPRLTTSTSISCD